MNAISYIQQVRATRSLENAYDEACNTVRQQAANIDALWNSRFFERRILDTGEKKLWPTTAQRISNAYDFADCDGEPIPEFMYCDIDGELYPVTIGNQVRHTGDPDGPDEIPFNYASSDMVANGKVVGSVQFTDH